MNLRPLSFLFLTGFCIGFPLVTAPTRWASNQNAFIALLWAATLAALILSLRSRSEPLTWTPARRIAAILGGVSLAYGMGLLGATYGMLRPDSMFFVPLSLGMAVILFRPEFLETFVSRPIVLSLIGFVCVAAIASLITTHQQIALIGSHNRRTGLLTLWGCVTLFLLVVTMIRTDSTKHRLIIALLSGGALVAALSLWQFFDPGGSARRWFHELSGDPRPIGTMGQANWFGTYLCLLLPLATAVYLAARAFLTRAGSALACLLVFASLLVCQTRGAWVAAACFLAWLAIRHRSDWRKLVPLFAAMALVAGVLIPSKDWKIYHRMLTFEKEVERAGEGSPGTGSSRFGYWIYGLKHLPPHLILGAGLDTYEEVGLQDATPPPIDKAHSIYLEYAVTLGLPGLALYLIFLWVCVKPIPGTSETLLRWGLKAAIVTYLIQGLFIHDTIHTWPLVWVIAGLAAIRESRNDPAASLKIANSEF